MMVVTTIALMVLVLALWGRARFLSFASQVPQDYRAAPARFDIRTHMDGEIHCDGVIFGPFGRAHSRFSAAMRARWDGNTCVLTEDFTYETGRSQQREWQLRLEPDGTIRALADDVQGQGRGQQMGNALRLCYRIRLPEDAGGHLLDVVDWMYLVPGGGIVNRSEFRKWGIKVAELVAVMRPQDQRDG